MIDRSTISVTQRARIHRDISEQRREERDVLVVLLIYMVVLFIVIGWIRMLDRQAGKREPPLTVAQAA